MDDRRKRLLFRSAHRGMQETDIFMGRFAERHLATMNEEQVDLSKPCWKKRTMTCSTGSAAENHRRRH